MNPSLVAHSDGFHDTYSHNHRLHVDWLPSEDIPTEQEWDRMEWDHSRCWNYSSREEDKGVHIPGVDPYIDLSRYFIPNPDNIEKYTWNKCHLLSLPKELRLEIWTYVLTDPSMTDLRVGITRQNLSPRRSYPKLNASILRPRNDPINLNLLLTNRFIYEEALPILYSSAKFVSWDLEGILPLFFEKLSPFALSCIRYIKLFIPESLQVAEFGSDPSRLVFHWAVTCAQVARLDETLRQVEITGGWSAFENKKNKRAILYPLCKIKTPKKYVPNHDAEFQQMLSEAEEELKAKAKLREERRKAEASERAKQDQNGQHHEMGEEKQNMTWEGERENNLYWDVESMLEEWDLVSVQSGTSTPRVQSVSDLKSKDEVHFDAMPTNLSDLEGDDMKNDSDVESEKWENIS